MSFSEIIRSLFGLWRLVLIDKRGVDFFDNDYDRTIRSFFIPIASYLIILLIPFLKADEYDGDIPLFGAILVQTIGFFITLFGYYLSTYLIVEQLNKKRNFKTFVQIHNWMTLVSLMLMMPILLIGISDSPIVQFVFLMSLIFITLYEWFVVQSVFKIQWPWVLLILVCGQMIDIFCRMITYTIIS